MEGGRQQKSRVSSRKQLTKVIDYPGNSNNRWEAAKWRGCNDTKLEGYKKGMNWGGSAYKDETRAGDEKAIHDS